MWKVAEVQTGSLEKTLNQIATNGGEIVQLLDGSGSRKDHVVVVWKTGK